MAININFTNFVEDEMPTWANPELSTITARWLAYANNIAEREGLDDLTNYPYYIEIWEKTYYDRRVYFKFFFEDNIAFDVVYDYLNQEDPIQTPYYNPTQYRLSYPTDFTPTTSWRAIEVDTISARPEYNPTDPEPRLHTQWWRESKQFNNAMYTSRTDYVTDIYVSASSIPFTVNGHAFGIDELGFTKDQYSVNVYAATTPYSDRVATTVSMPESYGGNISVLTYSTSTYLVNLSWNSPITGRFYNIPLNSLKTIRFSGQGTEKEIGGETIYKFTSNTTAQYSSELVAAKAPGDPSNPNNTVVECELSFADLPYNSVYMIDRRSFNTLTLAQILTKAQEQIPGTTEKDLFTEIHAKFYRKEGELITLAADKVCDFSNLLNIDTKPGGSLLPTENINDTPSIEDDNKYVDSIEFTPPTLTSLDVFNRTYALNKDGVNDLCEFMYGGSDSDFDKFINGLLTRGNPLESIIDLRLWPFDIRSKMQAYTAEMIKIGRNNSEIAGYIIPSNAKCIINLGTAVVPRYWNNFLDYHMTVELYIPFCGTVELPVGKVLNHKIGVNLICDLITGAGTAVVLIDPVEVGGVLKGIPIIYQQGIVGVSIPMTATNSSEWAKTIMGNIISGGAQIASGFAGGFTPGKAGFSGGNVGSIAGNALDTASALYNGASVKQVGSSSPQTSLFQPKNCYMILSIVQPASSMVKTEVTEADTYVWDNTYAKNVGYATFMPLDRIGNIETDGFYAFDNVKADIPEASKAENEAIISLLKSGIFIKRPS